MKKLLLGLIAVTLLFTVGCEKVKEKGNYKEGTYFGSVIDNYGGKENTATAVIYVDADGYIKSVFIDTTYPSASGAASTKKALGDAYAMKSKNPAAAGEWDDQINKLEAKIVEKQGIDFLTLDENGKTDTVAGCTIKIDAIKQALLNALNNAK